MTTCAIYLASLSLSLTLGMSVLSLPIVPFRRDRSNAAKCIVWEFQVKNKSLRPFSSLQIVVHRLLLLWHGASLESTAYVDFDHA